MPTKATNTILLLLIFNDFPKYKYFGNSSLRLSIPIVKKELPKYHHVSMSEHNEADMVKTLMTWCHFKTS